MDPASNAARPCQAACRFARLAANAVAAIVSLVLVGWIADVKVLQNVAPGLVPMMPNTCLGLLGAAVSLRAFACDCLSMRRLAVGVTGAGVALAVGALTLLQYATGRDFGIDLLLFPSETMAVWPLHPGRPSPVTATAIALLGAGMLALIPARRGRGVTWAPQAAGFVAATLAYMMLLGYVYDVSALYGWLPNNPMAISTAIAVLLLGAGLVAACPSPGLAALIDDQGSAGRVTRRLLLPTVLGPLTLGWARIEGVRWGLFPVPIGVGILVLAMTIGGVGFLWWAASIFARAEASRLRYEAALRQKDAEMTDLYEHAASGYHSLDATGLVVRMNATELAWLGYARDEVVGRMRYVELLSEASRATFTAAFPRFKAEGHIRDVPFELRRKDGSTFPVLVSATAIVDEAGRFVASRSVAYDMTERRRLEAALARQTVETEQAQAHAATQDFLLSTISHELKTPLSVIQGYAELLEDRHGGDPLLVGMLEGTRRLAAQVGRIIDLAALLGGGLPLYRQPMEPCELAEPLEERLGPEVARAGLTLLLDLPPGLPQVDGDATRLVQAIAELVDNARRATPAGGTITVRARAEGDAVALEVGDTGPGIPPEHRACAWQAFNQVGAGDAMRAGGLGLGLALVKGIAELHGGTADLACPPEGGTRVTVRLPARRPRTPAGVPEAEASE